MARAKRAPMTQPLQIQRQTPAERSTHAEIMGKFGSELPARLRRAGKQVLAQADNTDPDKASSIKIKCMRGNRLIAAAEHAPADPLTIDRAARRRSEFVQKAATTRAPGENVAGAGWYFDHARAVDRAVAGTGVDHVTASMVAARLSPSSNPTMETTSLHGLARAHSIGSVRFSPELVGALGEHGHDVSHLTGQRLPFHELHGDTVRALVNPKVRDVVLKNSYGVSPKSIGSAGYVQNIAHAHEIISGRMSPQEALPPGTAPKIWSYGHQIAEAHPDTLEHTEYMSRAAHLGDVMRGERHPGEQMLDFGLRHSQQGLLSSRGHTAEDSWMRSISIGHTDTGVTKATGDIPGPGKILKKDGVRHTASANNDATGESTYHAWQNAATQRTAENLGRRYQTGFPVPSTLVQETGWTAARRVANRDPEYNAGVRGRTKEAKVSAKEEKHVEVTGQGSMFGKSGAPRRELLQPGQFGGR